MPEKTRRIGPLNTLPLMRGYLRRLIGDYHAGEIDSSELYRLAKVVQVMADLVREEDAERRLSDLEAVIRAHSGRNATPIRKLAA